MILRPPVLKSQGQTLTFSLLWRIRAPMGFWGLKVNLRSSRPNSKVTRLTNYMYLSPNLADSLTNGVLVSEVNK